MSSTPEAPSAIAAIFAGDKQVVLACTGGGSGAIAALVQTPGASRIVLDANVPYSQAALDAWLGSEAEPACSDATARAMAAVAWQRARRLAPATPPKRLLGLSCTASLATDRPKRGPHRIHVATHSAAATTSYSLELSKGARSRSEEETLATALVLDALTEAAAPRRTALTQALLRPEESIATQSATAPPAVAGLATGAADAALRRQGQWLASDAAHAALRGAALFPGAFNPLHEGHRQMAAFGARRLQQPVIFELSILNVDKPPLDFVEIQRRVEQFRDEPLLLTRAPTFVEKTRLAPGAAMIVGADTIERIGQVRYYDDDPAKRDAAISELSQRGARFLVFGRLCDSRFETLAALDLPPALRAICDEVAEADFRCDLSSTELRSQPNLRRN